MIFVQLRTSDSGLHFHEAMAVAFLGGFAVRRILAPRPPVPNAWHASVIVLLTLVLASGDVQRRHARRRGSRIAADAAVAELDRSSTIWCCRARLPAAGLFAEGLFLLLAVADLCSGAPGRRRDVARMMVIGAAAAASLNIVRLIAVALTREYPMDGVSRIPDWITRQRPLQRSQCRRLVFRPDVLCRAWAAEANREHSRCCVRGVIAAGLWITGSRTALAAMVVVGSRLEFERVLAWATSASRTRWTRDASSPVRC